MDWCSTTRRLKPQTGLRKRMVAQFSRRLPLNSKVFNWKDGEEEWYPFFFTQVHLVDTSTFAIRMSPIVIKEALFGINKA